MQPDWRPCSREELPAPMRMPSPIWSLLASRNIMEAEEIKAFLAPSLSELRDPFSLFGMKEAVARLCQARDKQESTCIYADFDLDGTSGAALLYSALKDLGFENVRVYQPLRLSEGYGVHEQALRELKAQGVDLVVTVDVGVTAIHEAEVAQEIGMDLIITDHHQPKSELPEAIALVNPNLSECESGLGHLCGAGVAFYLVLALKIKLQQQGHRIDHFNPKSYLDCFVIGTLTDMVPVEKENRVLVKHGLEALMKTSRPGLRELMKELNLGQKSLSSQDVAIRFAPKLNALSRMEQGLRPLDIFLVESAEEAKLLIKRVIEQNTNRLNLQRSSEKLARKMAVEQADSGFIWVYSEEFHRGVVGLVATKLSQEFNCPSFVGSLTGTGEIVGSARIPPKSQGNLLKALEAGRRHLVKFGGHEPAAGFEILQSEVEAFRLSLQEHYLTTGEENQEDFVSYDVDAELSDLTPEFMRWYSLLEPFGPGFERPLFRWSQLELRALRELRGGHYRLTLSKTKSYEQVEALWFSPPAGHPVLTTGLQIGDALDVLASPQWNHYGGRSRIQLVIEDLRSAIP